MKPIAYVGNDVVDLAAPRTHGRATDERFVHRICDTREVETIRAAADPDLELWCHWAAKEAGYKIVSKLLGEPPAFAHRRFRVEWAWSADVGPRPDDPHGPIRRGRVLYEPVSETDPPGASRLEAPVSVQLLPDRALHAVGVVRTDARVAMTGGGNAWAHTPGAAREPGLVGEVARLQEPDSVWSDTLEQLMTRFSEREADAVYSQSSAAVRLAARATLADRLEIDEARLEIVCAPGPTSQRIPSVLVDGEPWWADVSLSHDGRWIAWAITTPG